MNYIWRNEFIAVKKKWLAINSAYKPISYHMTITPTNRRVKFQFSQNPLFQYTSAAGEDRKYEKCSEVAVRIKLAALKALKNLKKKLSLMGSCSNKIVEWRPITLLK